MPKPPKNKNYCATVVELKEFRELPNCDNVKAAIIFGNQVIVGKEEVAGNVGLFFPVETALTSAFLGPNNLYRKAEYGNADDKAKGGFFEQHGRVKCMKFRGHKSEGFYIPLDALNKMNVGINNAYILKVGDEFDTVDSGFDTDVEICHKYVPKHNPASTRLDGSRGRKQTYEDMIVEGQFRFHYDTANLKKNIHELYDSDDITITEKLHGTSGVFANILVKRKPTWRERIAYAFKNKTYTEYSYVWASRKQIKGIGSSLGKGGYHDGIWDVVAKELEGKIPLGFTFYGEIVGYTPAGSYIQKDFAYGCKPGEHKFFIYRITFTTQTGEVFEMPFNQVVAFCKSRDLAHVPIMYSGKLGTLSPSMEWFLNYLEREMKYRSEDFEGFVVRRDRLHSSDAWKIKSFNFLERETKQLDAGVVDMETVES